MYRMPYNETWEYFDLVLTTNLISGISKTTTTTTTTLTSGGWSRSLHVLSHKKKTISLPNSIYPFSGLKTLSFHTFVVFLAFLKLDKYHNDPVPHECFFSTLLVFNNLTTVNNERSVSVGWIIGSTASVSTETARKQISKSCQKFWNFCPPFP